MYLGHLFFCAGVFAVARACVYPDQHEGVKSNLTRRAITAPINTGDRFSGGTVAPRGLGSQPRGTSIGSLMSVKEIESAVNGLVSKFGIEKFTAPEKTHEGVTVFGGKVGNGLLCDGAYRIYLTAGIHARERGGPDNLIYFVSDLLWAQSLKMGLTYGDIIYTYDDVLAALSTGIIFMPLVNPDGVLYDQCKGNCWRRNRNPVNPVDLNRNFDFLWDFRTKFAMPQPTSLASDNPSHDTYHGTKQFSEPETRNVKWVMDKFNKLQWFVDLHSVAGLVLHSWGSDTNQINWLAQTFTNPTYDHKRGDIPDTPGTKYGEFVSNSDWSEGIIAATHIANGMRGVAKRHYDPRQSADLYVTSGASDDYAFSRCFIDGALNKIYSFTFEFGFAGPDPSCVFYPSVDEFNLNILETGAGFMEFLLNAARRGLGSNRECPPAGEGCAETCVPGQCGSRATCEIFNPDDGAPSFGNNYCFCQAGYKATGVDDTNAVKQYHLAWKNRLGDQTHRVLVNPGQGCNDLCGDNRCTEVPLNDSCR